MVTQSAGRVDIHCHLLPGVDDGPIDLAEAVATAEAAAADGTRVVACTPHFDERHPPELVGLRRAVAELQQVIDDRFIPLRLVTGAELALGPELTSLLKQAALIPLGEGPYMLVEYPFFSVPTYAEQILFELQAGGVRLVLAHPERCAAFAKGPDALASLVERGILLQVNAGSLLGMHGRQARDIARSLVTAGLAHVIASDGHSPEDRPPLLSAAESAAAELVGETAARAMVTTIPNAILAGEPVSSPRPLLAPPPRRRWAFRLPF